MFRPVKGEEVEVVFAGMFVYGFTDALSIYVAPTYKAYEIRLNDNRLSFFPRGRRATQMLCPMEAL